MVVLYNGPSVWETAACTALCAHPLPFFMALGIKSRALHMLDMSNYPEQPLSEDSGPVHAFCNVLWAPFHCGVDAVKGQWWFQDFCMEGVWGQLSDWKEMPRGLTLKLHLKVFCLQLHGTF